MIYGNTEINTVLQSKRSTSRLSPRHNLSVKKNINRVKSYVVILKLIEHFMDNILISVFRRFFFSRGASSISVSSV
jgi:hypothetical protein